MKNKKSKIILILILTVISVLFIAPIVIVFMNSFKSKLFINSTPFAFPNADSFVGLANYGEGMIKTGFLQAFFITLFITVAYVFLIVVLTSMTAWYLVRVKSRFTKVMYYLFAFAMIVPFQMEMFTLSKIANMLHMGNPWGLIVIYLGFGAGLSVFMFTGFMKSIPLEIEEAAMIDGCTPIQTFFKVVLPIAKPTCVTVTILQAMWIWNDYLLPSLVLDQRKYKTVPMAVQYLKGGVGESVHQNNRYRNNDNGNIISLEQAEFENNDDNRKALVAPTGSGQRPGKFDAPATNNETSADFPVMRCAEVMLMYAEAANELSAIPTQEALDALNAVRINANLMGKTLEELSTKEIFRQAVYKERRLELALECDRWFDIVRTGQMTTVFPGIAAYRQLYPIPQTEIENVSDKGGWQNEGYTVE